jgi:hypothetical protein
MKYNAAIIKIMLALALVATAGAETRFGAAAQQPEKLTFKMDFCGIGMFSSHQMYTASDGTTLNVDLETYRSLGKAKKALAKENRSRLPAPRRGISETLGATEQIDSH